MEALAFQVADLVYTHGWQTLVDQVIQDCNKVVAMFCSSLDEN